MKRIIALAVFILCACIVKAQSFDYVYKGVQFKCKMDKGYARITAFNVKAAEVTIPSSVVYKGRTYQVKQVSTFLNGVNYLTEQLTLEDGIEDIDKFCFNEFRKLQTVSLPQSISHIGKNAFRDNVFLTFVMPSSFDEQSIRRGFELFPQKGGEIVRINSHRSESSIEKNEILLAAEIKKEEASLHNADKVSKKSAQNKKMSEELNKDAKKRALPTPALPLVDVDIDIPITSSDKNQNTYCVIIANEKYKDVTEVDYAQRDGEVFKEYCIKTLGIPEKQIKVFIDASYTDIKRALNWMETMADVTDGNSKLLFYYAGHGMPDEKDKTAYLIPTDGFPKDISTCFSLSELYGRFGKMQTQNITVFLDACFSGVKRGNGQALVAARGIAIKPKEEVLSGNMVVFTAASDDETALAYKEKQHGMFTYFLLNKLKETKGKVSFGELFSSISSEVRKNSMLENEKLQTPSINVSANMKTKWKDLHF